MFNLIRVNLCTSVTPRCFQKQQIHLDRNAWQAAGVIKADGSLCRAHGKATRSVNAPTHAVAHVQRWIRNLFMNCQSIMPLTDCVVLHVQRLVYVRGWKRRNNHYLRRSKFALTYSRRKQNLLDFDEIKWPFA